MFKYGKTYILLETTTGEMIPFAPLSIASAGKFVPNVLVHGFALINGVGYSAALHLNKDSNSPLIASVGNSTLTRSIVWR